MARPNPGLSTIRPSSGGEDHSAGIELLDVVHEVESERALRAIVHRGEHAWMAVGGYDLGLIEARLARESRHVLGALPHVAVLCGDGGQGDPVLYPLDRGLATGFRGFTDGRVEIVCRPRAARTENYRTCAYQRCRSQKLAAVQGVRGARGFGHGSSSVGS